MYFDPILRVEVYGVAEIFVCRPHYTSSITKWRLPYKQLFLHIKKKKQQRHAIE